MLSTSRSLHYCMIPTLFLIQVVSATVTINKDYTDHELINGVLFFWPGQNLTLTCLSDNKADTVTWTYLRNMSASESTEAKGTSSGGGFKRMFHPLKPNDAGLYRCHDGTSTGSFFVNILDSQTLIAPDIITDGTRDHVTLRCNQTFERAFPLRWSYAGVEGYLNDVPATNHTYAVKEDDGWALVITNKGFKRFPLKTGNYTCELNVTTKANRVIPSKTLSYQAKPDVGFVASARSITATKDETFSITCIYSGHDDERIKWTVSNDTGDDRILFDFHDSRTPCMDHGQYLCTPGGDSRFMLFRDTDLENESKHHEQGEKTSVLIIKKIQNWDRGVYRCHSRNSYGINQEKVLVRVKEKLAALWPFLGVLAEIVVLAVVILLCERKRSKAAEKEEQVQLLQDGQTASGHPDKSLRNRK